MGKKNPMGMKPRKSPISKPKFDEAILAAAAGVKLAELRITALEFACYGMRQRSDMYKEPLVDHSKLSTALYKQLNDAWSNLAMWGLIADDDATRKKIAKLVWKRYLKEGMAIMHYLDPSGISPKRWMSSEQDSFRDDLNALADHLGIQDKDRSR